LKNSKQFFALCREEPFRLFFPLGTIFGITGVLLWPLFFFGITSTYPAIPHARLMIEGMMSCFIFGFLGTAGPRVLSVEHFSGPEVLRLFTLVTAAMLAHLIARHALGDSFFLAALFFFGASLFHRFRRREDSPPPNFALVGLGLLNGVVGITLLSFCEWTASSPTLYRLGASLVNLGFVLLPLLGVAPFFMRRLLDLRSEDDAGTPNSFVIPILVGLTIDLSFVLQLFSSTSAFGWIRFAASLAFLMATVPLRGISILATSLRMSLAAAVASLGLIAFLPAYRIPAMHVLFIGGFTAAVFTVATRVVLGHSGNLQLLQKRRWMFVVALLLAILAMISRFTADFVATRNEHLIGAAIAWSVAAALWSLLVLPYVSRIESD